MRFAEHDEVVERFATYRSDQPFNVAVLPRRAWRRRPISDPHCANAASIGWTISSVAVANQVTRSFVPGEGVGNLACRFRRRASLELEVLALRHQVAVLHRQRPGRAWLRRGDRLLWAWLYRAWPRCLKVMVLVKPATVLQWHRQGFRRYWRWRSSSRRVGRPGVNREIRDLIR